MNRTKYPFRTMEVGEVVTLVDEDIRRIGRRVCDHLPKKFHCNSIVRGDLAAVRVERLA